MERKISSAKHIPFIIFCFFLSLSLKHSIRSNVCLCSNDAKYCFILFPNIPICMLFSVIAEWQAVVVREQINNFYLCSGNKKNNDCISLCCVFVVSSFVLHHSPHPNDLFACLRYYIQTTKTTKYKPEMHEYEMNNTHTSFVIVLVMPLHYTCYTFVYSYC